MMCGARSGRARRWAVSCAGALFAVLSALSFPGDCGRGRREVGKKSVSISGSSVLAVARWEQKGVNGAGFYYLRYDQDGTPSWGDEKQFHASLTQRGGPGFSCRSGSFVDWGMWRPTACGRPNGFVTRRQDVHSTWSFFVEKYGAPSLFPPRRCCFRPCPRLMPNSFGRPQCLHRVVPGTAGGRSACGPPRGH
ncbi:MAG: hypothetical protein CM1200mP2_44720 [Planctomycetaceae bacterium]|nr:MAG: hypothetical protein CM1200mP2_44720 [Planctomycetaceae bacterium]